MSSALLTNLISSKPTIHASRKELSYPLYGADFDPLNHHFLLVGGGGGSSSTGVPNKITLLDTSNRSELREVCDLDLAKDEDSVISLAIVDSSPESLLAYAGINSSTTDQKDGKNQHLRSFKIPLPAKIRQGEKPSTDLSDKPEALSRTAIFRSATGPVNDCYQRVLRLSPPIIRASEGTEKVDLRKSHLRERLAVIASGLAPQNEVVTFDAVEKPETRNVTSRIGLEGMEANDVDIIEHGSDLSSCVLAYCTDSSLYLKHLGQSNEEPIQVYTSTTGRIRSMRCLNSRNLLLVQNRPGKAGVDLVVLKLTADYAEAQQTLVKGLSHMKSAVGMDAVPLSVYSDGSQQFVIAVAGQDSSVQILTLDWLPIGGMTAFRVYADLVNVHQGPITRVVFSNYIPPALPITSKTPPQYLRLATTGIDKSVVVQTLNLEPYPATESGEKSPRYVLLQPSAFGNTIYSALMASIVLFICLFLVLTFVEVRGASKPWLGTERWLPKSLERYRIAYSHGAPGPVVPEFMPAVESAIDSIKLVDASSAIASLRSIETALPAIPSLESLTESVPSIESITDAIPSIEDVQGTIADLVGLKSEAGERQAIVVQDLDHVGEQVTAELVHQTEVIKGGAVKKWEDLTNSDKRAWKQKLINAGQWTEKQGETVLKGVFFGQLAGIVGQAIG